MVDFTGVASYRGIGAAAPISYRLVPDKGRATPPLLPQALPPLLGRSNLFVGRAGSNCERGWFPIDPGFEEFGEGTGEEQATEVLGKIENRGHTPIFGIGLLPGGVRPRNPVRVPDFS
jgi:hypothetical protein